jgi:hypothetical protein
VVEETGVVHAICVIRDAGRVGTPHASVGRDLFGSGVDHGGHDNRCLVTAPRLRGAAACRIVALSILPEA